MTNRTWLEVLFNLEELIFDPLQAHSPQSEFDWFSSKYDDLANLALAQERMKIEQ